MIPDTAKHVDDGWGGETVGKWDGEVSGKIEATLVSIRITCRQTRAAHQEDKGAGGKELRQRLTEVVKWGEDHGNTLGVIKSKEDDDYDQSTRSTQTRHTCNT